MSEKRLHEEILDLDAKFSEISGSNVSERIQDLNGALEQLEPRSTSMRILIKKFQSISNKLRQMLEAESREEMPPVLEPIPLE
jgi:molecular chaperone GrpE (heat shock protein)